MAQQYPQDVIDETIRRIQARYNITTVYNDGQWFVLQQPPGGAFSVVPAPAAEAQVWSDLLNTAWQETVAIDNWRQGLAQEEVQSPSQSSTELSALQEKLKQSSTLMSTMKELDSLTHEAAQDVFRISKTSLNDDPRGDTWESFMTDGGEGSIVNLLLRIEWAFKRFTVYLERAEERGDNSLSEEQMRQCENYILRSFRSQQTRV